MAETLSKTAAMKQAITESDMRPFSGQYVLRTYDDTGNSYRDSHQMGFFAAREAMTCWRVGRALDLMGRGDGGADSLACLDYRASGLAGSAQDRLAELIEKLPVHNADEHGTLCDYETGDEIREATKAEQAESIEAAAHDGGAGVIRIEDRRVYVQD